MYLNEDLGILDLHKWVHFFSSCATSSWMSNRYKKNRVDIKR